MNSSKLSVATTALDAGTLVRVEGTIDESADTQTLLPAGAEVVIYDLDGVKRITSYGVLQWVKALKDLRARYYGFMRCRPCIVRQFNMVAGFGKHGEVLSVYLPYFCEGCDAEFENLLDLRADFVIAQTAAPPEVRCPTCSAMAEFDDVPKSFLAFSADYPRPNPPELAVRLINEALRLSAPRTRSISPPARPSLPSPSSSLNTGTISFTNPESRSFSSPESRSFTAPPPAPAPAAVVTTHAGSPESVDRLRKLQDDLDVTRDRLSKMIKDRKSKT